MSVSAIIVTYNNEAEISSCLQSLSRAMKGIDHEIIVVDNGSSDNTIGAMRRIRGLRVYISSGNIGFARAVNAAAKQASKDYLLLVNPDATIVDTAVLALLEYAQGNPDRVPLGGKSFHPDGTLDPRSCWASPSVWSTACFALGLSTIGKRLRMFNPEAIPGWQRDDDREVGVITGALLLCPMAAWRSLGGFDRRFWMYGEDTDLSTRAAQLGYRPGVVPGAVYFHPAGASSTPLGKLLLVLTGKASYMLKQWGVVRGKTGVWLLKCGVLLRRVAEGALARPPLWRTAWDRRNEWSVGFPPPPGDDEELTLVT